MPSDKQPRTSVATTWDTPLDVVESCSSGGSGPGPASWAAAYDADGITPPPTFVAVQTLRIEQGAGAGVQLAGDPPVYQTQIRSQATCAEYRTANQLRISFVLYDWGGTVDVFASVARAATPGVSIGGNHKQVSAQPGHTYDIDVPLLQPVAIGDPIVVTITVT